jgi:hypothetical protein
MACTAGTILKKGTCLQPKLQMPVEAATRRVAAVAGKVVQVSERGVDDG